VEMLAPWAEPVLMTAAELLRLPDDGWRYELVEGRLVRMSPTGWRHGRVDMALLRAVDRFVEEHHLGNVCPAETGFRISPEGGPDTVLAPDLAFVRAGREPAAGTDGYPHLAPDLVAEGVSPSQGRAEMGAKAQRWLSGRSAASLDRGARGSYRRGAACWRVGAHCDRRGGAYRRGGTSRLCRRGRRPLSLASMCRECLLTVRPVHHARPQPISSFPPNVSADDPIRGEGKGLSPPASKKTPPRPRA